MDKLKVAVIMEDGLPTEGGGFSYYQTLLIAINKHSFNQDVEIVNLNFNGSNRQHLQLCKEIIHVKKTFLGGIAYQFLNLLYKSVHRFLKSKGKLWLEDISRTMDGINNRAAVKILRKENIQLVYYLKPQENVLNYPMIVTHWDVGHKSMYPFPEVAWNGNFEKREKYYQKILNRAFLILCESEAGARELQYYYPVNPGKIKVLPLFSGDVVSLTVSAEDQVQILSDYNLLPGRFYMYPAQFWAHKNHSTLIHAFRSLLTVPGNETLKLVLCGGDQGNLFYIKDLIDSLDLSTSVLLPGFIDNKNLYALYKNTLALVMPTFLGPTNIPLIEAAELECAVICSNLEGHKEILGTNALYFDPASTSGIQGCMQKILDKEFRNKMVAAAYQRIRNSCFQVERSIPLLDGYLNQLRPIRKAWGADLKLWLAFVNFGILTLN